MSYPTLLRRIAIAAAFTLTFFAGFALGTTRAAAEDVREPRIEPNRTALAPMTALGSESAIAGVFTQAAVDRWNETVFNHAALMAALAEAERAQIVGAGGGETRAVGSQSPPGPASSGDCSGFPIPSYIIQRESGGSPSAYNPSSGAIGCTQTLISHYQRGECAGLDPYTVQGQRDCTWLLSDGGTNLQPWASTR